MKCKMRTILILSLFLISTGFVFGRSYYIDFKDGNDYNDGLSPMTPLKSMTIIQNLLVPGDSILFKSRTPYEKCLDLHNFRSEVAPIVITSYGPGRAIISAGLSYGLHMSNCRNIIVENLIFSGSGRLSGNTEDGVVIEDCENIQLNDIDISGFQHSGMLVLGSGNHIRMIRIYANDNGFAGIHVYGKYPDKYQCKNIYIGHSKAKNNPGDPTILNNHSGNGIIVGACDSVLIEFCEALENGWDMPRKGNGPVGIWAWHADHVIIQHCISHHNKTSEGAADGGGFDLDGGVTNSFIQYCVTYDNEGPGFGIFEYGGASQWKNNTLRYNISINDGSKNGNTCVMFWNGTGNKELLRDSYIYNNVFYNDRTNGSGVYYLDDCHKDILFTNNIFLTKGPAFKGSAINSKYLGNVYWNMGQSFSLEGYSSFQSWIDATGNEMLGDLVVGMNLDPLLMDPGPVTLTDPDSINMNNLKGFRLRAESPVIDKGLDILTIFGIDPGGSDLFRNEIPAGSGFDPGVHEFQDVPPVGMSPKISVDNVDQGKDWIQLFPNPPGKGPVYLKLDESSHMEDLRMIITDIHGKVVYSNNLRVQGGLVTVEFPGSFLRGMLYFISVSYHNNNKTFKLLF